MILWFQGLSVKTRLVGVVVAFFLSFCAFYAYSSTPWLLVQLKQFAPGTTLPDQAFWYTPAQVHALLGSWGVVGRDFYRTVLFPYDLVFPVLYSVFFLLSILYLLKKINPRGAWWYLLGLLPLLGGVADVLENLAVFSLTWLYPDRWDVIAWLSATFTATKWVVLLVNLTAVVALVLVHWGQRLGALMTPRS